MKYEITAKELDVLPNDSFVVADIRNSFEFEHDHIDGAVNISFNDIYKMSNSKKIILCGNKNCEEEVRLLCASGYDARYIRDGFNGWITDRGYPENFAAAVEQSIRKQFHSALLTKFKKAVTDYRLINNGDRIAVCISGGKDSMLLAKLMQEYKRQSNVDFDLIFLVMDPGYSERNLAIIQKNAAALAVPVKIFETNIFNSVYEVKNNPCYLCSKMRRGHLYKQAQILGCNKIALGHHFDDVIETILMAMIYGGQVQTMMPKLHSDNFEGVQLIRPMYLVRETDIKRWCRFNGLHFIQCACRFTDENSDCNENGESVSKRKEIKALIAELRKRNPQIEYNIFRSVENINLKRIISYKDKNGTHSFLDGYED